MEYENFILIVKNGIPKRIYRKGKELPGKILCAEFQMKPNDVTTLIVTFRVDNFHTMELEPKAQDHE